MREGGELSGVGTSEQTSRTVRLGERCVRVAAFNERLVVADLKGL
jgi:hypothetical protein